MTPEQVLTNLSLELQTAVEQARVEIGNLQFAISQAQEVLNAQYAVINQREAALEDAKRRLLRLEGGLNALNLIRQLATTDDSQGG